MNVVKPLLRSFSIPAILFLGACCCDKDVVKVSSPTTFPAPPAPVVVIEAVPIKDVFFDFDKSDLRRDAVEQLKINVNWLREDGSRKVVLEGHCDRRGSDEYNHGLGARRARAVKNFIVDQGINSGRLKIINFGEEHPFAEGNTEEAWAQNRRVHFVAE